MRRGGESVSLFQEGTDTAGPSENSNIATPGKDRSITFRKNDTEQQSERDKAKNLDFETVIE